MEPQIQAHTQTPWTVDGFVGTPDMIDNTEGNDYFQFNPSTPRYVAHQQHQFQQPHHSFTHPGTGTIQFSPNSNPNQLSTHPHPQPGFIQAPFHLNNDNNEFNLQRSSSFDNFTSSTRSHSQSNSHRSNSSISSHLSSNFNWSTSSEVDDSSSLSTSISPSLIGGQPIEDGNRNNGKHGRIPSLNLSIDPNLFKSNINLNNDKKGDNGEGEGEEIEMLETAKPKSTSLKRDKKKEDLIGISPLKTPAQKTKGPRKERSKKGTAGNGKDSTGGGSGNEGGKKVSHARKQTADHIPRPRNAFILFRKHVVDSKLIPASVEMRHQNVSIITAKMWSEAPPDQKAHFNELARIEKEEHLKKYPGYRYQPVYRRTNVIRRRVRKDEAEEQKCKSVAELLIKGKSGEALENEIKEKIKKGGNSGSSRSSSAAQSIDVLPELKAQEKPNSRRSSAACELSKGALRALRAQARLQSNSQESGDWSDITSNRGSRRGSRSNSLALSIDPSKPTRSISRQSYSFEFEDNCDSNGEESDNLLFQNDSALVNHGDDDGTQMLGYGLAPSQVQGFVRQEQQQQQQQQQLQQEGLWNDIGYFNSNDQSHSHGFTLTTGDNSSFHQNQSMHDQLLGIQSFSFPPNISIPNHDQAQMDFQLSQQPQTSFPETSQSISSDPSTSSSHNFLYPQPGQSQAQGQLHLQLPQTTANTTNNDFYTYDTALPFSPSIANFSFQHNFNENQNQNQNQSINGSVTAATASADGNGGELEGIYEFTLPNDSTQTQVNPFFNNNNNNDENLNHSEQFQSNSNSNNFWDINKHNSSLSLLPPSSGVPLENLPFDDHFILGDFEAALAHADEAGDEIGSAAW